MARYTDSIMVFNGYGHHLVGLYRKPNADRSSPHRCRPYHIDSAHPLFVRCPPITTKHSRILQYLSPTMGFFLAIFYFGESFGTAQLIAFWLHLGGTRIVYPI